jgi:tetratricopeptide (TPR) repeat protein
MESAMAVGDARSWSVVGAAGRCLLVAGLTLGGVAARADEIATIDSLPLAAAYGGGVHAYFAGDYARSHDDLSSAIQGGIDDPRAWYFRGLAALRLGRIDEAEADFTEGAERESRAAGMWPVSRSLERVQGPERLQLERHRIRARVAALQRDREAVKRRYSGIEEAQPELLRRIRPVERLPAAKENPFADRPAAQPTPAESVPAPAEEPAADPLAAPAEPAAEATEPAEPAAEKEDPFGASPEPAAEEKPAAEADPFGAGGGAPANDL